MGYALLVQLRCTLFDYMGCNFSEQMLRQVDKRGVTRDGTGRVAIGHHEFSLPLALTLEMNYSLGDATTFAPATHASGSGRLERASSPQYTVNSCRAVGRA